MKKILYYLLKSFSVKVVFIALGVASTLWFIVRYSKTLQGKLSVYAGNCPHYVGVCTVPFINRIISIPVPEADTQITSQGISYGLCPYCCADCICILGGCYF